jgi:hypothetical protein
MLNYKLQNRNSQGNTNMQNSELSIQNTEMTDAQSGGKKRQGKTIPHLFIYK